MPINTSEILSIVSQLTKDRHVRVTVKESIKGGCIVGATTTGGALLLGPAGMLAGV
jgi:hypothetical protein